MVTLKSSFLVFVFFLFAASNLKAQDPNFHIYLCFGQSNMEGQGTVEAQDQTVDTAFKVFQSLTCGNLSRTQDQWYTAVPPLCNCWSGLSPADYFGRKMVDNLPDSIRVGVINVAVGGCDIRLFDKDIYQDYDSTYVQSWFLDKVAAYGWNPYQHLIDRAQLAQNDGVIKGILLHQGETNTGDANWPSYVKKIYNDMLTDLSLDADSVPLLAGEVMQGAGACCSFHNTIIARLPDTIPTSSVIPSTGLTGVDNAHFDSESYREFGRRYADRMLHLQGVVNGVEDKDYSGYSLDQNYPNPTSSSTTINFTIAESENVTLRLRNSTGKQVAVIADGKYGAGTYSVAFSTQNLIPGIYLYSIEAGGFTAIQKLVVSAE